MPRTSTSCGSSGYSPLLALTDIKIAHTVFALPFALLAAVLALPTGTQSPVPSPQTLFPLILACMFFARTWAMLVNRLADREFDRDNPRTAARVFASGRLTPRQGWAVAGASALAFVGCCALFWVLLDNPWPLILCGPVLGWIALYSYTKRFTWSCHLFLGGALAASPIAALIAVNPDLLWSWAPAARAVALLAGFVLLWVAGFDIAYALQDFDFDRRLGLHSIPAAMGPRGALGVARGLHAGAFVCLWASRMVEPRLGAVFAAACVLVGAILIVEHWVLARRGVAGLPLAFFTLNGVVSIVLGAAGIADVVW
ncbi:MAG TPA: 4-hydroxybenzoate octaprenyltransferase [Phycisphaerales bacterium]|nr:4-hydroxybenzoate octaprenyltransferase [Phycisphaerales bacterium]